MDRRLMLHEMLCKILGSRNVYFQPPESIQMKYPAIRYSLGNIDSKHANNNPYIKSRTYEITLIDRNPDSVIVDKIASIPTCRFDRHYISNNLNHFVFTLTF